jgi:nitrate/nitrite-specific signal transduction histidine kinase
LDASALLKRLKGINPNKNLSVIDTMARELEKYAEGLEDLVNERTMELEQEQKKSEELLYREYFSTLSSLEVEVI